MKIKFLHKMFLFLILVISIFTLQPTRATVADEMEIPVFADTYVFVNNILQDNKHSFFSLIKRFI